MERTSERPTQASSQSQVVIPARLESSRLARKMLLAETGKPLIQHTYESALTAARPAAVCVATDHADIVAAVERFGGKVRLTDPHAASGTDRVAEVARDQPDVDIFVNVQGDEPEISANAIDLAVELLENDPNAVMSTLATPLREAAKLRDAACVKVVCDERGRALYFSRSPIPAVRDWDDRLLERDPPLFLQHIGLYAYRREFLLKLATLPRSPLEIAESLEQLRVLSAGYSIQVGQVDEPAAGIDTAADYDAFVRRWRNC